MRVEVQRKGDPVKVAGDVDVYENAKAVIKSYSNTDILVVKCINGTAINYNLTEIAWWSEKPRMEEDSPEEEEAAHWIETEVRGTPALICSNCWKDTGTIFEYDVCPNCRKKMNKAATWRLKGGTDE